MCFADVFLPSPRWRLSPCRPSQLAVAWRFSKRALPCGSREGREAARGTGAQRDRRKWSKAPREFSSRSSCSGSLESGSREAGRHSLPHRQAHFQVPRCALCWAMPCWAQLKQARLLTQEVLGQTKSDFQGKLSSMKVCSPERACLPKSRQSCL